MTFTKERLAEFITISSEIDEWITETLDPIWDKIKREHKITYCDNYLSHTREWDEVNVEDFDCEVRYTFRLIDLIDDPKYGMLDAMGLTPEAIARKAEAQRVAQEAANARVRAAAERRDRAELARLKAIYEKE